MGLTIGGFVVISLLVGLGNPGSEYHATRHNLGFRLVDSIAARYGMSVFNNRFHGQLLSIATQDVNLMLFKPLTYMNDSGVAVSEVVRYYKIKSEAIVVAHDDLDLECGKVKIKIGGGTGGHNGLKSIDHHLGSSYHRLRIGISRPTEKIAVSDYVLQRFRKEQQIVIDDVLLRLVENIEMLLKSDKDRFFLAFNRK